ncbi:MAG TPA: sterol desaturase family protein [Polyangiales bacterium]|nr:sterol desaturase family protein [Polyangiales bacterium]
MTRLSVLDRPGAPLLAIAACALGASELARPLRPRTASRTRRWPINGVLGVLAAAVERGLVVGGLAYLSRRAARRRWGVLPRLRLGAAAESALALLALDAGMYLWHRLNHRLPLLWRFHAVHHTDLDLDFTTAARLHPGELLLSLPVRGAQLLVLGAGERSVLAYEGLMQLASLFYHSDVDLGARLERVLGSWFMTPALHTRHHAATQAERDCNWGVVLSLWDRALGSFDPRPATDHRIGTSERRSLTPRQLWTLPWRSTPI